VSDFSGSSAPAEAGSAACTGKATRSSARSWVQPRNYFPEVSTTSI